MQVEVKFRGLESSDAVRAHAHRRVRFQLGRFGHQIHRVLIRLEDVNGPKGGVDTRCQVTVHGPELGSKVLDELSTDPHSAVDLAITRLARSVARQLGRGRTDRRRRERIANML